MHKTSVKSTILLTIGGSKMEVPETGENREF
jgi:hypothetical protein